MNIPTLFEELEQETSPAGVGGTLVRRVATASPCDLFVGIKKPDNLRSLRIRFSAAAVAQPLQLPKFRGVDLTQGAVSDTAGQHITITLQAANAAFSSVFTSLAADVAQVVRQVTDEPAAASAFISRLFQWQRLLERQGEEGLKPEAQRGLYGELWFLREYVLPSLKPVQAVSAWTGPEWTAKDFQFSGCAVEVKTSTARQHQHLQIASEKQLDDAGWNALFLCHLSLEAALGTGETLPEMVGAVRNGVAGHPAAEQALEERLFEAGYLDIHEPSYSATGYILRSVGVYRVREGFPRIIERDLAPGVGDVRYSISAAECLHHSVTVGELLAAVQGTAS